MKRDDDKKEIKRNKHKFCYRYIITFKILLMSQIEFSFSYDKLYFKLMIYMYEREHS